jgi:hypothetical protein
MASHASTVEAVNRTLKGDGGAGMADAAAYGGGGGGDSISRQELEEAMARKDGANPFFGAPVVS